MVEGMERMRAEMREEMGGVKEEIGEKIGKVGKE